MPDPDNAPENTDAGMAAGGTPGSGRDHLRLLGKRVAPLTGARERTLPVPAPLRDLFGGGGLQLKDWMVEFPVLGRTRRCCSDYLCEVVGISWGFHQFS